MGLLDDAIREHLELKRRHGASDDEVARQEAEALGPARRDFPVAAEPAGPAVELEPELAAPGAEPAVEPEPRLPSEPAKPAEAVAPEVEPAENEPTELLAPEGLPAELDEALAPNEGEHASAGDPLAEPEAPPAPEPKRGPEESASDRRPAADEPPPRQRGEEGEDVLEETPEFLQDAPEHDRLWFEQRPPRDFDFD